MKEVQIEEILSRAKEEKGWHFHMLGKECKFNEHRGKFAIVLEGKENMISIFNEEPLKEAKQLADLMYGKDFLGKQEKDKHNPDFDPILKKAQELVGKKIEWHHHHLHPDCRFNENKGNHCIVLEDPETKETLIATYDQKPMEDLVKLERLLYRELEK